MTLIAGDILVRPLESDDAERVFEAAYQSIPEVSRWLPWCHENYSIEETREFLTSCRMLRDADQAYAFGTFRKSTNEFLGGVGLSFINRVHQFANLGYWVRTSETRKGVASTAARLVAQFGFEQLGLKRIEILTAVSNISSQRVAERIGAVREGVLRKRLWIRDEAYDAVLFSLVREDL